MKRNVVEARLRDKNDHPSSEKLQKRTGEKKGKSVLKSNERNQKD